MSKHLLTFAIAAIVTVAISACSGQSKTAPASQDRPIGEVAGGSIGGKKWRVSLVDNNGSRCTLLYIENTYIGGGCPPSDTAIPMNFAVDNTTDLEAIYGVVRRPAVDHMSLVLKNGESLGFRPKAFGLDSASGYFAFVVKKSAAESLFGYGSNGKVVASGGDKIRTATVPDAPTMSGG